MECHRHLDTVSRATASFRAALALILLTVFLPAAAAQSGEPRHSPANVQQLFEQHRWTDVIDAVRRRSPDDADTNFYYASALAHLGQWDKARTAFHTGMRRYPHDSRFPIELAGVAFKQKNYAEAAQWLHRGLAISPDDGYANDFLATIYFLEGNLEAALKYWNRAGKPRIQALRKPSGLRVDPELFDRAFSFAPATVLRLPDLRTTEARIGALGIFPSYSIRLDAHEDGSFDAEFRGTERDGWGGGKWPALLSAFRGVFYETIYPEYTNLGGAAINLSGLVRWDSQKRRLLGSVSGPIKRNPQYRYSFGFDLRDENWVLLPLARSGVPSNGSLTLGREALNAGILSINSGSWKWSAIAELSHRSFGSVVEGSQLPPSVLLPGWQLKENAILTRSLWRVPERRFDSSGSLSAETGRIWSAQSHSFEKLQADLQANWKPQPTGDDYAATVQLRTGKTYGTVPFDELFMLGMERDNNLPMRAHIGTFDGRKGSAPMGRNYVLLNSGIDKNVYSNGFISAKLSPFVDIGNINDPLAGLGTPHWLWDTGIQLKVRVMGVGFEFTYGKDLRTGNNAFYFSSTP